MKRKNLFCIDPGLQNIGWSFRKRGELEYGKIITKPTHTISERIKIIIDELASKTKGVRGVLYFVEDINFIPKGREKSSVGLLLVLGAILISFNAVLINPFSMRKSLIGKGNIKKPEIIEFVNKVYSLSLKNHNIADALLLLNYVELVLLAPKLDVASEETS